MAGLEEMDDHENSKGESIKSLLRRALHIGSLVWLTQALLVFTLACALYLLAHCENNVDPNGDLEPDTLKSSLTPLPTQSAVTDFASNSYLPALRPRTALKNASVRTRANEQAARASQKVSGRKSFDLHELLVYLLSYIRDKE